MAVTKRVRKPVKKSARKSAGPAFGSYEALERVTRPVSAKKDARNKRRIAFIGEQLAQLAASAKANLGDHAPKQPLLRLSESQLSESRRLDLRKWCVEQAVKWPVFPLYPSRGEPGRLELRSPAVTAWAQQIYDWVTK
jgi:hypothetical protein